jgi:hypothetical protein
MHPSARPAPPDTGPHHLPAWDPRVSLLSRIPFHPLLFAAYAVLFLYAANLGEVLPVDAIAPLEVGLAITTVVLVALSLAYRDARRGGIVATALVITVFAFGHVAPALSDHGLGDALQVLVWLALIVAAAVYAARAGASLPRVTTGLNVAALVLVLVVGLTIVPFEAGRAGHAAIPAAQAVVPERLVAAGPGARRPDIYYLIFDRYGSADAIERRFGITGNDLYGWLRDRGFQVPADAHGSYRATDFSLASTLNMRYLDELTVAMGRVSGDRLPAQEMIRHHEVGQDLKSLGYTYYHLGTWFEPTRTNPEADEVLNYGTTSEFESVLLDTTILPALGRMAGTAASEEPISNAQAFLDRHREGTLFELRQLRRLSTAPGPKFVFAHFLLPHDPYVFRADGSLRSQAEYQSMDEPTLYADHLAYANSQIKDIVGYLLAGPESERPIVIIQGDEGPLACQSVDCVGSDANYFKIRLGLLNAMYLPGIDVQLPDRFTSVNTFRLLFSEYFGADLPPLPEHAYTWPDDDHIYDFQEITDLITAPDD